MDILSGWFKYCTARAAKVFVGDALGVTGAVATCQCPLLYMGDTAAAPGALGTAQP